MKGYGGIRKLNEYKFILDFQEFVNNRSTIRTSNKSIEFSSEKEARSFADKNNIEIKYFRKQNEE